MAEALHVDKTFGAGLVGFSITCVAFGTHTLQVFSYFQKYPLDRRAYKVLVASLWSLELIHQLFVGHAIYFYIITNFASPFVILLEDVVWTLIAQIVLGTIIGTIVKICFAMRVWRFSQRNIWVIGVLGLLILGQLAMSFVFIARCFQLRKITFLDDLILQASFSLGLSALTDIATAGVLVFYLRRLRTGHKQADSLVSQLIVYAINTGAVTSITTTVLYDIYTSENFYFMALYFVLIKMYAISFMCTLNTRRITRGRGTDRDKTTSQFTTGNYYMVHLRPSQRTAGHAVSNNGQLTISIHQEVSVLSDEGYTPYVAPPPTRVLNCPPPVFQV